MIFLKSLWWQNDIAKCLCKINVNLRFFICLLYRYTLCISFYIFLRLSMYYLAIHSSYLLNRRDKTSMITEVIFSFICHVNGTRLMTFQFCVTCFQDEKLSHIIRSLQYNSSIYIDLNLITIFYLSKRS